MRRLTFAWDRFQDERLIIAGIERCQRYGIKPENMQFFVLIGFDTTPEQDLYRVNFLKDRGCYPFAMPYDKFDPYQRRFTRWVNHKAVFRNVPWSEYKGNATGVRTGDKIAAGFVFTDSVVTTDEQTGTITG